MKGIGRGTIQRCDARPLTAPFLLMFHNYYHAINSNGTGGRPLRKRHSSARVINIRFWFAENSLCRSQPSPFLSPFFLPSFFFFTRTQRIEKGFLDLSPTVHFFPLPRFGHTFPSSRAITPEHIPKSTGFSLSFAPPEVVLTRDSTTPLFLLHGFEFFRGTRISLLDPWSPIVGEG